jgi:MFS family permease
VCDMDWAPQAVNSCYFVGFLVGAGLWGTMSDRIGAHIGGARPLLSRRLVVLGTVPWYRTGMSLGMSLWLGSICLTPASNWLLCIDNGQWTG